MKNATTLFGVTIIVLSLISITIFPQEVFAQTPELINENQLSNKVSGTDFMIEYNIVGGDLISITPDIDSNSLIYTITAPESGTINVILPREIIDAKIGDEDDDFFVLVDGEEFDYVESTTSIDRTLAISFPAGSEEIEIIGTHVVPEFGSIAVLVLSAAIVSIIAVSAKSKLSIMPRY